MVWLANVIYVQSVAGSHLPQGPATAKPWEQNPGKNGQNPPLRWLMCRYLVVIHVKVVVMDMAVSVAVGDAIAGIGKTTILLAEQQLKILSSLKFWLFVCKWIVEIQFPSTKYSRDRKCWFCNLWENLRTFQAPIMAASRKSEKDVWGRSDKTRRGSNLLSCATCVELVADKSFQMFFSPQKLNPHVSPISKHSFA